MFPHDSFTFPQVVTYGPNGVLSNGVLSMSFMELLECKGILEVLDYKVTALSEETAHSNVYHHLGQ